MMTSGFALLVSMLGHMTHAYINSRRSMQESISSLARVVGTNCVASLIFDDQAAAKETLSALAAEPQVAFARIYSADGSIFAEYYQKNIRLYESKAYHGLPDKYYDFEKLPLSSWSDNPYRFRKSALDVFEPIVLDQKVIGILEVSSDLGGLYRNMGIIGLGSVITLALSALLAYTISNRTQRTISAPISILTQTMSKVSQDKDYTTRVETDSRDELGVLFNRFNEMLAEIQARDERLHFIQFSVDHMGDAIEWIDSEGNIVDANNAACQSLGYSREELLSMTIFELDPNDFKTNWKELYELLRHEKFFTFETKHIKKNMEIFPVEIFINYLEFKGREYSYCFVRDITDRKRLQLQLEQAKKMEAIGTLAGGVAHDLNNILGGLVSYPELLLLDLPSDSPLRKPVQAIQKSGEKAAAVVQDMLTLARRGVNLQTAVNLNDVVSEYLKSPEHEKIYRFYPDVCFEISLEKNLPNIIGSAFHLSKALMNLVSNAVESMVGGGKVRISTGGIHKGPKVARQALSTIPEGNYVVLSVTDEGPGISEKDRMRIFEPFYTKKVMGRSGTGLGMTVVSGTVEDHKGFIDLKSKEGHGTCFDLFFPVTQQVIQHKETPSSIQAYMGSEKILVVDDMKEQRDLACHVLGKLGYQVDTVPSGEAALAYLQEKQVDLLILDMIMDPGMDGLETFKKILNIRPYQRTVIASGYAETGRVKETLRLGAGAYVKKPYTIEKLGITVREELNKKIAL